MLAHVMSTPRDPFASRLAVCWLFVIGFFIIPAANAQLSYEEALDGLELSWSGGGTLPWTSVTNMTHDGADAVTVRPSWPWTTPPYLDTTLVGPGTLSFWWKISSDTNRIVMRWFLDGYQMSPNLSGEVDWTQVIFNIGSGIHTARWQAVRFDYDDSIKTNFCWLDQVNFAHASGEPEIVQQPISQTTYGGGNVTLNTLVSGGRPLNYQWFRDGTPVSEATNATVTFTNIQLLSAGVYQLRVTNANGATVSSNAVLSVFPVLIEQQPASLTVVTGRSAYFYFSFYGYGPLFIQWRRDGVEIPSGTNQWIELPTVSFSDAGAYTATISNSFGVVTSAVARLTVVPDLILNQIGVLPLPASAAGLDLAGNIAIVGTFDFSAATNGLFVVDISAPADPVLVGRSTPNYVLDNLMVAGRYAYAPAGQFFNVYDLIDPAQPVLVRSSYFTPVLDDVSVRDTVAHVLFQNEMHLVRMPKPRDWFDLSVTPLPYLRGNNQRRIRVEGTNAYLLSGASFDVYDVSAATQMVRKGTCPIGGRQFCIVGQHAYIAGDTNGLLIVSIANPAMPTLIGRFTEFPSTAYDVDVSGSYAYVITSGGSLQVFDIREPTAPGFVNQLWINAKRIRANGKYVYAVGQQFRVLEAVGTSTAPPVIRQDPLSARAPLGGSNTFTATVVGEPPLNYQWLFNNAEISGATNWFLTVENIDAGDFGTYRLVVTNQSGVVAASANATLTLSVPPNVSAPAFHRGSFSWDNSFSLTFTSQSGGVYAAQSASTVTGPWITSHYVIAQSNLTTTTFGYAPSPRQFFRVRSLE
jgi:hypothetical protein